MYVTPLFWTHQIKATLDNGYKNAVKNYNSTDSKNPVDTIQRNVSGRFSITLVALHLSDFMFLCTHQRALVYMNILKVNSTLNAQEHSPWTMLLSSLKESSQRVNPQHSFVFIFMLWLFAFSCTAAGCIITQTGTIQSTFKRKASRSAAVKTAITAHQKHWRISPRLRMWCTQRWVWNKQFIWKMVSCICKRFWFNKTFCLILRGFFLPVVKGCFVLVSTTMENNLGIIAGISFGIAFFQVSLIFCYMETVCGYKPKKSWTIEAGCRNQLVLFFLK